MHSEFNEALLAIVSIMATGYLLWLGYAVYQWFFEGGPDGQG